jgi:hypothetical protein
MWVAVLPTIESENSPPQAIAGIDGNHGESDPVGIANDVEGTNDCVFGNTEGGKVVCGGGSNGNDCDGTNDCWGNNTGGGKLFGGGNI